ncbi:hypothetical protein CONPUDRAFT_73321 [Coniophora puteana RWD-64-598 SS2]|uniref:F-box domain-containing protein n=1 Tax=Coniophora puteana (strain RWD-64-598) TaxID=741705 RepID=A0A5M3MND5_CONPW|nr:uncharacterized protein CONPUDRAFT_73321 [Coniophora puteana RWD-64-598 SS2]EIW80131.1 hypothetical protein CONPUDRAFT_73321 [Coniophora puteana RWD-64-598 SS2]
MGAKQCQNIQMLMPTRRSAQVRFILTIPHPLPPMVIMNVQSTRVSDEFLVAVFLRLDLLSLTRCKQVCKHFQRVIEENDAVRYDFELQAACLRDAPSGGNVTVGTASRLAMLQAHRRAWDALSWSTPAPEHLFTSPDTEKWLLVGDVLCIAGPKLIQCIRLPSSIRNIELQEWKVEHTLEKYEFTVDPAQDLLVLVEDDLESIHLLTLSMGVPHPDTAAHNAAVFYGHYEETDDALDRGVRVKLSGKHLGLFLPAYVADCDWDEELVIWDWKSGKAQVVFNGSFARCFAFLPDDLILLGHMGTGDLQLCVYDLGAPVATNATEPKVIGLSDDVSFVCTFEYGGINGDIESMEIRSQTTAPSTGTRMGTGMVHASPFVPAPAEGLFSILISMDGDCMPGVTLLSLSAITRGIASARACAAPGATVSYKWEEWGKDVCHSLYLGGWGNSWSQVSMRGFRCASMLKVERDPYKSTGEYEQQLVLRDFHRCTARRYWSWAQQSLPEQGHGGAWKSRKAHDTQLDLGAREVEIKLPKGPGGKAWDEVLLGEDAVVFKQVFLYQFILNKRDGGRCNFAIMALEDKL